MTKLLREDKTGKVDYSYLVELKPLIDRICNQLTLGEKKYARMNYRNCEDPLTYKQSALRHMMQYMNGERDEDHGIASIVNLLILLDLEHKGINELQTVPPVVRRGDLDTIAKKAGLK